MDCTTCQEILSARLDGEAGHLDVAGADAHRSTCAACAAFEASAQSLHRSIRVRAAEPVPDLASEIVAAATVPRAHPHKRTWKVPAMHAAQVALGFVGLVLLATALPTMVLHDTGGLHEHHVTRELAAFQVALAGGFLLAALTPARAAGLLPTVAILVVSMTTIAAIDLGRGETPSIAEAQHLLELGGLFLIACINRADPSPVAARGRLRLA
jgi:predicted anti-sigma-YlaC factor YlaD